MHIKHPFYCIEMNEFFHQLLILKQVRNYKGENQTGSFDVQGQLFSRKKIGLDPVVRKKERKEGVKEARKNT